MAESGEARGLRRKWNRRLENNNNNQQQQFSIRIRCCCFRSRMPQRIAQSGSTGGVGCRVCHGIIKVLRKNVRSSLFLLRQNMQTLWRARKFVVSEASNPTCIHAALHDPHKPRQRQGTTRRPILPLTRLARACGGASTGPSSSPATPASVRPALQWHMAKGRTS